MPSATPPRLQLILAFAAIYIIWGSTYLAIRFAIETMPPFLMSGARYLTAGILVFLYARLNGAPAPKAAHWRSALVVGFLLLLLGNGCVAWAEKSVPSSTAALIVATVPLWFVLFDWLLFRAPRPAWQTWAGLAFGFLGIVLLVGMPAGSDEKPFSPVAGMVITSAAIAWSIGSLYSRQAQRPANGLLFTSMQMLCGGAFLILGGLVMGEHRTLDISAISTTSWLAWIYLIVFGSMIAFSAYAWLVQVARPGLVSTYAYVNPIIAMFLGWFIGNEVISAESLTGSVIIILSVILIGLSKRKAG